MLSRLGSAEFVGSLVLLALLVGAASVSLALDGNTLKARRVSLACGAYLLVLILGPPALRLSRQETKSLHPPSAPNLWWFNLAGGASGLVSGTVRHDATLPLMLVQTAAAALLIGSFHWWALRAWARFRSRLVV